MMSLFMQVVPPLIGPVESNWQVLLPLLVGVLSPLVVALVTRWNASSGLKAVLNLLVSATGGYLTQLPDGVTLREAVFAVLVSWLTAVVSYQQITKPLAVSIAVRTRGFGVGGSSESLDSPSGVGRPKPSWD